jgi:hypothetical protein
MGTDQHFEIKTNDLEGDFKKFNQPINYLSMKYKSQFFGDFA